MQILILEFIILAVIILVQSFDYLRISDTLRGVDSPSDPQS